MIYMHLPKYNTPVQIGDLIWNLQVRFRIYNIDFDYSQNCWLIRSHITLMIRIAL